MDAHCGILELRRCRLKPAERDVERSTYCLSAGRRDSGRCDAGGAGARRAMGKGRGGRRRYGGERHDPESRREYRNRSFSSVRSERTKCSSNARRALLVGYDILRILWEFNNLFSFIGLRLTDGDSAS